MSELSMSVNLDAIGSVPEVPEPERNVLAMLESSSNEPSAERSELNPIILQAQIEGLRIQRQRLMLTLELISKEEERVLALLKDLPDSANVTMTFGIDTGLVLGPRTKRHFSEEARARIRDAQAKRWADARAKTAQEIKTVEQTPAQPIVPAEPKKDRAKKK